MGETVILLLILAYLLPTVVACSRGSLNRGGVFLINLLLGWTLLGWLSAFIWACTSRTRRQTRLEARRHQEVLIVLKGANDDR